MIEVYAVKININLQKSLLNGLIQFLPGKKQKAVKKICRPENVQRAVIGDILVQINVIKKLGIKNSEIVFENNSFGKPFLKGFDNFHFNISHSGEWVVCAIHNLPVGIDIQVIKQVDWKIAEWFCSKSEYIELLNRDNSQKLEFFFVLWTLKESYVKTIGKGFSIPLGSFSLVFCNSGRVGLITGIKCADYYFKLYNIDENYKMAVCSCADDFPEGVVIKDIEEIYEEIVAIGG